MYQPWMNSLDLHEADHSQALLRAKYLSENFTSFSGECTSKLARVGHPGPTNHPIGWLEIRSACCGAVAARSPVAVVFGFVLHQKTVWETQLGASDLRGEAVPHLAVSR